ncbi:hypothetical protein, partial [Frankia sp. AvcI1]
TVLGMLAISLAIDTSGPTTTS